MPTEVILPRVDMDMESGKIGKWYIAEGGQVEKGQLLFEIETSKAAMEIEASASGVLRDVTGQQGDEVAVGTVIGRIFAKDEKYTPPAKAAHAAAAKPEVSAHTAKAAASPVAAPADHDAHGLRATPKARRLAREMGVALAGLQGTGPRGRIQAQDVSGSSKPSAAMVKDAAGINREWLVKGSGMPLVLIHGFGADLNSWRPLLGSLPPDVPVFAVDLPGHGKSPLTGVPNIDTMADAVAGAMAGEGVSSAHLVGHSLGGAVAAALSARLGAGARSLTLIAPAGLGPGINGAFVTGFLAASSEAALAPWMALLTANAEALGPALVKTTLRQRKDMGGAAGQAAVAAAVFPEGTQTFSVRKHIDAFAGPTKVIFGLEDQVIPPSHAKGLAGTAGVHLFAGVGHMPQLEARAAVGRLIAEQVAAGSRAGRNG